MRFRHTWLVAAAALAAFAQDPDEGMHARQLYYRSDAPAQAAPAKPAAAAKKTGAPAKQETAPPKPASATQTPAAEDPTPPAQTTVATPEGTPVLAAALHFGVRYNVLRVIENAGTREVDPQTVFHTGDRAAIRFRPNRDGYLSVFTQAASGQWKPLLPQPGEDARNYLVKANQEFLFPQDAAFRFEPPAGTERLFVVITERPADLEQLNEALKDEQRQAPPAPVARPPREQTMLAMNRLDQQVRGLYGDLRGRDIVVQKVSRPVDDSEPPHSVYAVRSVARSAERVVFEIVLRHE